jgi:eukaryotic-like serine/threonine-protein kinase
MGEVYKSTDTRLDRTVAVKVLPQHVASDPQLKQRFELEAKTLAALVHPHICSVFDVGSQHGVDFLVMEYLEGETLEQRLGKGPLPLDQALQLGIQAADALAAAHRAGIVHRDLKPGNIMLTKTGARLRDFGLAKASAPAVAGNLSLLPTTPPSLTVPGALLGTFQYMAPEQVEGQEEWRRSSLHGSCPRTRVCR